MLGQSKLFASARAKHMIFTDHEHDLAITTSYAFTWTVLCFTNSNPFFLTSQKHLFNVRKLKLAGEIQQDRGTYRKHYLEEEIMKRNLLSSTLLGCCSAVLVGSAAFGQPDNPCGRDWKTPMKEITGTITKVYDSYMLGTQKQGRHLDVAVDGSKETVTVHVFPANCITNNPDPFKFKKGERVTATGSEFSTQAGRHQNICAQSVSSHRLPDLRDKQNGSLNKDYCIPQNICEEQCRKRRNYEMCMKMCPGGIPKGGTSPRGFRPGPR